MVVAFVVLLGLIGMLILFIIKLVSKPAFAKIHKERKKANAPKILYLRSFDTDGDDGSHGNVSILKLEPKDKFLANALIHLPYHLVAVGIPLENLPDIGFDPEMFDEDKWQTEVLNLLHESRLIIWRANTSEGVLWEIEKILELNYRHKLIVWADMGYEDMEERQEARYIVFKRKAFEKFDEVFPSYSKRKKFLASNNKNEWQAVQFIHQLPVYKELTAK